MQLRSCEKNFELEEVTNCSCKSLIDVIRQTFVFDLFELIFELSNPVQVKICNFMSDFVMKREKFTHKMK